MQHAMGRRDARARNGQGRESIDAVALFGSLLAFGAIGREFLRELRKG